MKQRFMPGSIAIVAISMLVTTLSALAAEEVSYRTDVFPIINDYCLSCHKPGGKGYNKSGLDMRTYQSLMTGTKFGSVIKPGDSYTSIFIQVIEGRVHPSLRMPYGMSGGLAKDKIELMRKWVQQGAKNN